MTLSRGQGGWTRWSHLPLRTRLTVYFILVSVPPVLLASFIAAQAISTAFERNVEQWITEIASFIATEASEGREEAEHATDVVAVTLSNAGAFETKESIAPFADLLESVGYDFVRLYTADGTVLFSGGDLELRQPLPKKRLSSIFFVTRQGHRALMVGAAQAVRLGTQDGFLFVGNLLDERFFTAPQTIRSLDLHLIEVAENGDLIELAGMGGPSIPVPDDVLRALRTQSHIVTRKSRFGLEPTVAFTGLRNNQGELVGVIACRLNGAAATFERLGTFWLFLALAGVALTLSLMVGITISRRIADPLRNLTQAVRAVTDGNYHIRVREEGGRELEDLAGGFNNMTAQLQTLRDMEAQMRHQAQLSTLGQAAAVLAHEIRNPLGIIKTSAEVVRRRASMAPSEDRLLHYVLDEVDRIERLVKALLDYARPAQCASAPMDLVADVVRPVLGFVAPELRRRDITLAVRIPDVPTPILGDADMLHQAILNLLINAMDAVGPVGHIIVRVTPAADHVSVEVEDDGPGVPEEVRETVFDPFVTTKANGTGLGLATVRSTVEAHHGAVFQAQAPEGGAIFTIRLPLQPRPDPDHGHEDPDR